MKFKSNRQPDDEGIVDEPVSFDQMAEEQKYKEGIYGVSARKVF